MPQMRQKEIGTVNRGGDRHYFQRKRFLRDGLQEKILFFQGRFRSQDTLSLPLPLRFLRVRGFPGGREVISRWEIGQRALNRHDSSSQEFPKNSFPGEWNFAIIYGCWITGSGKSHPYSESRSPALIQRNIYDGNQAIQSSPLQSQ